MRSRIMLVLASAAALLALAPAAQSATSQPASYALVGSYTVSCSGDVFCGSLTYTYDGTATCGANCQDVPSFASFSLALSGSRALPPNPCVAKRVSGTLTFSPTDPNYPPDPVFASLTGRARDHKAFVLDGSFSSGLLAGRSVSLLVNFPPNPCTPAQTTGTLSIFPPEPI
jgi:hypothetical protein